MAANAQSSTSSKKLQKMTPQLASPTILGIMLLILGNYYSGLTYTNDPRLVFGLVGVLAVLGASHFIAKLKFGSAHAPYLIIYHLLLSFLLIAVVPTLSFYLYIWVLLLYLTDYYYGLKGAIVSSSALLLVMLGGTYYQQGGLSSKNLVNISAQFIIILFVIKLMSSLSTANRHKRSETITKVARAEGEHDRLVALINSMSDAVIATDDQGVIVTYNAAALDILDTNETLTGKKIVDYLKVVSAEDKKQNIFDIAKKTDSIQRRSDLRIAYGKDDSLALDITISRVAKSTVLDRREGYTFLLRDITLQKTLDDEKDLFIHEVSHELRNPITVAEGEMSMAIMLAEKPQLDFEQIKQTVDRGHKQVVFLGEMINDLSALSRATHDKQTMKVEQFSIKEVLEGLEADYKAQAKKKGLYLKLELAPSVPEVTSSKLYLKEILENFITNAIKYTKKGGVTIKGQAIDKDHIMLGVSDTGIGIAKAELDKVYRKFWRSEDPSTREVSGTGLGLYVTKHLADNIGAEIKVESELKQGSTFSIIMSTKGKDQPISRSPIRKFFKFGGK